MKLLNWIYLHRSKSPQQHQHQDQRQSSTTREWSAASGKGNLGLIRANSPPELTAGRCPLFKEFCKNKMKIIHNTACSQGNKNGPGIPEFSPCLKWGERVCDTAGPVQIGSTAPKPPPWGSTDQFLGCRRREAAWQGKERANAAK